MGTTTFSSEDAVAVINDALSEGNYVFAKSGTYNLTTSLKVYSHAQFRGYVS